MMRVLLFTDGSVGARAATMWLERFVPAELSTLCIVAIAHTPRLPAKSPSVLEALRKLLLKGPRKFQDFRRSLHGISPNALSSRLRRLLEHGIVTREFYGEHPPRAQYALTDKGRALGPVLRTLRDWGTAHTRRTK